MTKKQEEIIKVKGKQKGVVPWTGIGTTVMIILLVLVGVMGTLRYQEFIANTKLNGVIQYQLTQCESYMNEDRSAKWLECDTVRIENNK